MSIPAPLCADAARERGDTMQGTALHVRRFVLIEHPGPWGFDALGESGIDPDVRDQIVRATRVVGARTLLIRRYGRRESTDARRWAVADVVTGRVRWGTWTTDDDLLAARDAISEDSADWSPEPVLLVCTHGRHDTCCAVRGRPVAEALTARHGDRVWECTHVGGDRFAASVVVLPDGTYYGGLDGLEAGDVIDRHLAGTVTPGRLRGSTLLPPVAQAAAVDGPRAVRPGGPARCPLGRHRDDERWGMAGRAALQRRPARTDHRRRRGTPGTAGRAHVPCLRGDVCADVRGDGSARRLTPVVD